MKLRNTRVTITNQCNFSAELLAGEVYDLPEAWADRLLRGGNAAPAEPEPVVAEPPPVPEPEPEPVVPVEEVIPDKPAPKRAKKSKG